MMKKTTLEIKIDFNLILLKWFPINTINVKLRYIKMLISENPIIKSKIIRLISGTKNFKNLLLKLIAEKRAIPVIGAKFGGWGISLVNIAKTIKPIIKLFFFKLDSSIIKWTNI